MEGPQETWDLILDWAAASFEHRSRPLCFGHSVKPLLAGTNNMKLNQSQLDKVEQQLGVAAVSDDNPATPKLRDTFGDHTFFVDAGGLSIVEKIDAEDGDSANVIKVAEWTDDERSQLRVHEPEPLAVVVDVSDDEESSG